MVYVPKFIWQNDLSILPYYYYLSIKPNLLANTSLSDGQSQSFPWYISFGEFQNNFPPNPFSIQEYI